MCGTNLNNNHEIMTVQVDEWCYITWWVCDYVSHSGHHRKLNMLFIPFVLHSDLLKGHQAGSVVISYHREIKNKK